MKIECNVKEENKKRKLKNGDVIFCKADSGSLDFIGIYTYGIGIIDLETGSDAAIKTLKEIYLGDKISYWTVTKIFKNVRLIIDEVDESL